MSTFQALKQRKSPTRALNPHQLTNTKQIGQSVSLQKLPTATSAMAMTNRAGTPQSNSNSHPETIVAKYSNEFPRVELHPHDIRKFRLYYAAPNAATATVTTLKPPAGGKKPTSLYYGTRAANYGIGKQATSSSFQSAQQLAMKNR